MLIFFEAEKFSKLSFTSPEIKKIGESEFQIIGELTVKDVSKTNTLETEYSGLMLDPCGNTKAGLSISGKINRKDFGLTWNAVLETGGVLVGEEVKLFAEAQFLRQ